MFPASESALQPRLILATSAPSVVAIGRYALIFSPVLSVQWSGPARPMGIATCPNIFSQFFSSASPIFTGSAVSEERSRSSSLAMRFMRSETLSEGSMPILNVRRSMRTHCTRRDDISSFHLRRLHPQPLPVRQAGVPPWGEGGGLFFFFFFYERS